MVNIKLVNKGNEALLFLSGRLDANNAPEVGDKLLELSKRFDRIVLDLDKVPYVSSAGLRAFLLLYHAMGRKGGAFAIQNVRKDVMDVFNVTGFGMLLDFE